MGHPAGSAGEAKREEAEFHSPSSPRSSREVIYRRSTSSSVGASSPSASSRPDRGRGASPQRTFSSFSFASLASAVTSLHRGASSELLPRRARNRSSESVSPSETASLNLPSSPSSSSSSAGECPPISGSREHGGATQEEDKEDSGLADKERGRLDDSRVDDFDMHGALVFDDYDLLNYPPTALSLSMSRASSLSTAPHRKTVQDGTALCPVSAAESARRTGEATDGTVGAPSEEGTRDSPPDSSSRFLTGGGTADCMEDPVGSGGVEGRARQATENAVAEIPIEDDGTSLLVDEAPSITPPDRSDCFRLSSSSLFPFFWSSSSSSSSFPSSSSSSFPSSSSFSPEVRAYSRGNLRGAAAVAAAAVSSLSRDSLGTGEARLLWHPLITRCVYGPLAKARFYLMMHPEEAADAVVVLRLSDFLVRRSLTRIPGDATELEATPTQKRAKKQIEKETEEVDGEEERGRLREGEGESHGEGRSVGDRDGERGADREGRGPSVFERGNVAVDVAAVEMEVLQIYRRKPQGIVILNDLPLSCPAFLRVEDKEAKQAKEKQKKGEAMEERERETREPRGIPTDPSVAQFLPDSSSDSRVAGGEGRRGDGDKGVKASSNREEETTWPRDRGSQRRSVFVPFTRDVFSSPFLHEIATPLGGFSVPSSALSPLKKTRTARPQGAAAENTPGCSPAAAAGSLCCAGAHAEMPAELTEEGKKEIEEEKEVGKEGVGKTVCTEAALAAALEAAREAAARQDGDFESEEARLAAAVQRSRGSSAFRQNFLFEDEVEEKDDEWIDARKQGNNPVVLLVMRRGTDLAQLAELDGIRHACITPIPLQLGDHIYRAIKPRGIL
ncbi:putative NC domain-containing protein [Neospora caninum Liverpool]|nr:putative NC domain-containing protein [Neospora caninum Liverpool]CBZ53244.1 putative NC domain-containing protein [Neospora caninum Liverpool]|eukprot:XP_003883276.1 putative NC domain-containing protein [Neospora caninum Liverpool]